MKLISMTDFVLTPMLTLVSKKVLDKLEPYQYHNYSHSMNIKYANFLKQPLELWMFIPCDKDGNVLEKPIEPEYPYNDKKCDVWAQYEIYLNRYQQAKERCLFEGFEVEQQTNYYLVGINGNLCWLSWNKSKIIEDLIPHNLQLTPTAIKQIGCDH